MLVETGAGAGSAIPDSAFAEAGATIVSAVELYGQSDVILRVAKPSESEISVMRSGQAVVGFLSPADRSEDRGEGAGEAGRHRDQPRRDPAHAVAGPDDGRPELAGQRRRLQGGPAGGQRVRPLLPAADDGGRDGQARQRPDPGHRRRRAPGDRHRAAARRGGQGLRRPTRDARAGRIAGRPVRQAQDDDRCDRRGRVRPRADGRGTCRPAGGAQRGHRRHGRGDHHGPGPGPQAAAPGHRRRRRRG